jgi:hypothetical protein
MSRRARRAVLGLRLLADSAVAPCLLVTARPLHQGRPTSPRSVGRAKRVRRACKQNKQCRLTSGLRQRGFQACAVRPGPWPSCSSSEVGQQRVPSGSEHWGSCLRSQQWTWRDQRRAGKLRERVGGLVWEKERAAGGGERAAGSGGEGSARHSMRQRRRAVEDTRIGRKEARRR